MQFKAYIIFKKVKGIAKINFLLAETAAQSDKGGRILLGNNADNMPVMLWPFRFQYEGVSISNGLLYIYV
jgi:hypothetical protein